MILHTVSNPKPIEINIYPACEEPATKAYNFIKNMAPYVTDRSCAWACSQAEYEFVLCKIADMG